MWGACRDWHTGSLLCKQKAAANLSSVAFTEDSSHILTAGKATLKVRGNTSTQWDACMALSSCLNHN